MTRRSRACRGFPVSHLRVWRGRCRRLRDREPAHRMSAPVVPHRASPVERPAGGGTCRGSVRARLRVAVAPRAIVVGVKHLAAADPSAGLTALRRLARDYERDHAISEAMIC